VRHERTIVARRKSTKIELRQEISKAPLARRCRNTRSSRKEEGLRTQGWLKFYKANICRSQRVAKEFPLSRKRNLEVAQETL
jgi:hypothetical protein